MIRYHDLIEEYLKTRTDLKSSTIKKYRRTLATAVEKINYRPISEVSEEERHDVICYCGEKYHGRKVVERFFSWCRQRERDSDVQGLCWNPEFYCWDDPSRAVFDVPSSVFPLLDGVTYLGSSFAGKITHYRRAIINDARSETEHQVSVMNWTRKPNVQARYPDLAYIYHIPNEISGSNKMTRNDLERIREERYQMGVQAGIPDFCLPVARGRYHALYIEMKSLKRSATLSEKQLDKLSGLRELGNAAGICYGDVGTINLIVNYLELSDGDSLRRYAQ